MKKDLQKRINRVASALEKLSFDTSPEKADNFYKNAIRILDKAILAFDDAERHYDALNMSKEAKKCDTLSYELSKVLNLAEEK